MRAAPAVDALLADGRTVRVLRWLILALHLAAMAAVLVWAGHWLLPTHALTGPSALPWSAWLVLAAAVLLVAGVGVWQASRLLPAGTQRLRWDGAAWQWLIDGQVCALHRVSVQIDLGHHLLLRLHAAATPQRARWAVATARSAGPDWHGLRVALHYHAGASSSRPVPGGDTSPGR